MKIVVRKQTQLLFKSNKVVRKQIQSNIDVPTAINANTSARCCHSSRATRDTHATQTQLSYFGLLASALLPRLLELLDNVLELLHADAAVAVLVEDGERALKLGVVELLAQERRGDGHLVLGHDAVAVLVNHRDELLDRAVESNSTAQ